MSSIYVGQKFQDKRMPSIIFICSAIDLANEKYYAEDGSTHPFSQSVVVSAFKTKEKKA